MAQSLSNILLHLVFSTRQRQRWIDESIADELHDYIGGTCRELKCQPHRVGGTEDHVRIACSLSRAMSVAKLIEEIKTSSSKWIKTKGHRYSNFSWQSGYGAFSVGQSQLGDLRNYIIHQLEHHARVSFQDEFRKLLERYEIPYDEQYVWD